MPRRQEPVRAAYAGRHRGFDEDVTALTSSHRLLPRDLPGDPRPAPTSVPRMLDEAGVRLGLAHAGLVLATLASCSLHLPATASLALLGLVALTAGLWLPGPWALGTGVSAWALWTGFCENGLGQLTLSGGDLRHLALLPLLAAVGVVLHHVAPQAVHLHRGPGGHRG